MAEKQMNKEELADHHAPVEVELKNPWAVELMSKNSQIMTL